MTALIPAAASSPRRPRRRIGSAASLLLRDLLRGPVQPATVVGATRRAAYVAVDRSPGARAVVALEGPGGVRLPNAVALGSGGVDAIGVLRPGQHVVVGGGGVSWDWASGAAGVPTDVVVGRWWDPRARPGTLVVVDLDEARSTIGGRVAVDTRPFGLDVAAERLRDAVVAPSTAQDADRAGVAAACHDLVGRGPGMTPAGDDVLAGLLAVLRHVALAPGVAPSIQAAAVATADRVARATLAPAVLARTNDVSADLLRCADRGGVTQAARDVLAGIGTTGLPAAVDRLSTIGHTSGRDLLVGMRVGLDVVVSTPRPGGTPSHQDQCPPVDREPTSSRVDAHGVTATTAAPSPVGSPPTVAPQTPTGARHHRRRRRGCRP